MSYVKLPANKLREFCLDGFKVYTLYRNSFPKNCLYKDSAGTIWGDCVCFIKSMIWAWACGMNPFLNRKINTYFYNGANGSYDGIGKSGLPDLSINQMMLRCAIVPFNRMQTGTLIAYQGDHIAVYIDLFSMDGKKYNAVEFNYYNDSVQGLIPLWVDHNGAKFDRYGGNYIGSFTTAGNLLEFIDYQSFKTVTYRSETLNGWLPEVISTTAIADTAGLPHDTMIGFMVKSPTLKGYCCRLLGDRKFLPVVTGYDENEPENGYAGDNRAITDIAINDPGIAYRVKTLHNQEWLPVVYGKNYDLEDYDHGFAGDMDPIDEIEIWRID